MLHNVLNTHIIANFVAKDINTNMSQKYEKCYSKWQNIAKQVNLNLELQAHDWNPYLFFLCNYVA